MYSFEMDLSCGFINGFLWSGGEQREREFLVKKREISLRLRSNKHVQDLPPP